MRHRTASRDENLLTFIPRADTGYLRFDIKLIDLVDEQDLIGLSRNIVNCGHQTSLAQGESLQQTFETRHSSAWCLLETVPEHCNN